MTGQLPLFDDAQPGSHPIEVGEQMLEPIPINVITSLSTADRTPSDSLFTMTKNYNVSGGLVGRLLRALSDKAETGENKVSREMLASELTIPTQRVDGLFNFVRRAEMVSAKYELTLFGHLILTHDPYLLNTDLLWFLHYFMASNARLIIWNRLFDHIFFQNDEVSPSDATDFFLDVKGNMTEKVFLKNCRNEIGAILRTYADDLFKSLGLVVRFDTGQYTIITDEFNIQPYIWLATVLVYRDRYFPGVASLETRLLIDAHFSPGRLFRQKEAWVRRALDELHNLGLLTVETRLGLDQVRFKSGYTWLSALAHHFQEAR